MLEKFPLPPSGPEPTPQAPEVEKPSRFPFKGALDQFDFVQPSMSRPGFSDRPGGIQPGRVLMAWSMAASLIDLLIVFSFVCLFLFLSLLIEKLGLSPNLQIDRGVLLRSGVLVFAFLHSAYLVLLRVFLGSSFGEWACDLRLGLPRQRFSSRYTFFVLKRFVIVVLSGVVLLPFLSLLTGVDWAGRLSGLPLISVPTALPK